ncbi:MAG: class II fumarate hydratase [Porticoccaceae bacterium]
MVDDNQSKRIYGEQTRLAIENFSISGLRMPPAFIQSLGLIKQACAEVNLKLGLLSETQARAISKAAGEIWQGKHENQFPVDVFQTGSGTSTNMNANEVIASLATSYSGESIHPNDHVNLGQSSNDVIPSCITVSATLLLANELKPSIRHLIDCIDTRARELDSVVKTGRTHLMDAMPLTFGQELSGWSAQLNSCLGRLENTQTNFARLALGGTAIGTGINSVPEFGPMVSERLSGITDLPFSSLNNYFEGIASQDSSVELSGQLKTLAVTLMKISNDLRWMGSGPLAGLGEIVMPKLQAGSSIMPGKVNPVIAESTAMVCAQVIGNDTTITVAGQSGNFQLNVMLPVIAYNLLQSLELLSNSCANLADKAIAIFEVNGDRLQETLAFNPILVTALNPVIGYEKAAEIAQKAYAEKRPVLDVAEEMTDIGRDELERILDPVKLTGRK